jgi:hypothetical protein
LENPCPADECEGLHELVVACGSAGLSAPPTGAIILNRRHKHTAIFGNAVDGVVVDEALDVKLPDAEPFAALLG